MRAASGIPRVFRQRFWQSDAQRAESLLCHRRLVSAFRARDAARRRRLAPSPLAGLPDEVGVPVSTYRRRLRARAALERLSGGETDLARLAADAGFADHAHLTHELRALLGATPSALRARWT